MRDTSADAQVVRLRAIRAMDGAARLRQAIELSEGVRQLALAGLRARHPECTEEELVARLVKLQDRPSVVRQSQPMSAAGLLEAIVSRLDLAGIPFMLTGSMAAAVHGAGRSTLDIDLVIEPTAAKLRAFVASIASPDRYVSDDAAAEALARESMFNVVDARSGWKADLIIRKSRQFSKTEFARRQPMLFEGIQLWVATLEDLIVAKLEWARLGGSARQIEDVASLLRVAGGSFDQAYISHWVEVLDLQSQWQAARTASEEK